MTHGGIQNGDCEEGKRQVEERKKLSLENEKNPRKNIVFSNFVFFFLIGDNIIHLQVKEISLKRKLKCTCQKKKE